MRGLLEAGFIQSVRMIVDAHGLSHRAEHQHDPGGRGRDRAHRLRPIGVIEPGQVAAQRFRWEALVGRAGDPAAVNWLMGEENLDPPGISVTEGERFEVEVRATPPCSLTFKGLQPETIEEGLARNPGIVATATTA